MDEDLDDITADIRAAMSDEPVETEAPEPVIELGAGDDDGPARDEVGRFAKKAEEAPETEWVANPTDLVENPTTPLEADPATQAIRPPNAMSPAAKAQWETLPPELKQEFARLEQVFLNGRTEWSAKGEKLNRFEAVFAPHRDRLTLNGLDEVKYVEALVRADEMLRTNPMNAIGLIAQQYGINLGQSPGQQPVQQQGDPELATLKQEIAELRAEREGEHKERINADIEAYRADPKYLYFDNVAPDMAALLRAGLAKNIPDAYDRAIWARDDIRPLLINTQQPKPSAPALKGKPAGLSVAGAPSAGSKSNGAASTGTIEDDVRASIAELQGRL